MKVLKLWEKYEKLLKECQTKISDSLELMGYSQNEIKIDRNLISMNKACGKFIREKVLGLRQEIHKHYFLRQLRCYRDEVIMHRQNIREHQEDVMNELRDYFPYKKQKNILITRMRKLFKRYPSLAKIDTIRTSTIVKAVPCFWMNPSEDLNLILLFGNIFINIFTN
jgi:hypothetical protein